MRRLARDLAAHRGEWGRPGFQALVVHRFGTWRAGLRSGLVRKPLTALYYAASAFVRNVYSVEVGEGAVIGEGVVFEHSGQVIHGAAVIGDGCVVRQNVTLGCKRGDRYWEAPVLGAGVDIGAGAVIVGDITVGDGARIGANAVVSRSVPAGGRVRAARSEVRYETWSKH